VNRHDGTFITGVLLLVVSGLADAAVGVAMRAGSSGRSDTRLVPVSVGGAG